MKIVSACPHPTTIARRALIIQRVIVDEWTIETASATFGVPERLIAVWVTDYRRFGMASLRGASGRTRAAELVEVTISRPARAIFRRILHRVRKAFATEAAVQPLSLRRSNEDAPR
jgi:hypothetical protein